MSRRINKPKKFHVTFFLHMQGMDEAVKEDFGIVEAYSPEEAKDRVVRSRYPNYKSNEEDDYIKDREFFRGCLSAREIIE